MEGGGWWGCLILWFLIEKQDHLVDLLHLLRHLQSPAVPMCATDTHVHTEWILKVLVVLSSDPLHPAFTIVSLPLILRNHVPPYPQPMVHHNHNMRRHPCPLEVVAKFNVLAMMPVILPATILMKGFFILTMLLNYWLEQLNKNKTKKFRY